MCSFSIVKINRFMILMFDYNSKRLKHGVSFYAKTNDMYNNISTIQSETDSHDFHPSENCFRCPCKYFYDS